MDNIQDNIHGQIQGISRKFQNAGYQNVKIAKLDLVEDFVQDIIGVATISLMVEVVRLIVEAVEVLCTYRLSKNFKEGLDRKFLQINHRLEFFNCS